MLHPLRPCHLAHVDQAFNALLQLNESAVVGHADDASAYVCTLRIAMLSVEPRIGCELLESKRDTLFIFVVLENFDLNLIADVNEILGMGQASPGHIGDVQQAIESAEIDERTVLGEILHDSGKHRTFFQVLESLGALLVLLAFEQFLARDHDVAALLVQLDDCDFDGLTLHPVQIADGAKVDLRPGQKRVRALNIYREAALDAIDHTRLDRLLLVVSLLNFFPGVDALSFLVRKADVPLLGFALIAHDIDFVARLELWLALVVENFRKREHAFRFCPDVYYYVRCRQLQHGAFDHAIFADRLLGFSREAFEHRGEILVGRRCVRRVAAGGRLGGFRQMLFSCRFGFCDNGGGGIGMGGGSFVEQGYASLMMGCGACVADCWMSRLVVVGPPWRVSLDNPSCRTYNREPASNGNSSTITTAREQCQTQIPRMLQQRFNLQETV